MNTHRWALRARRSEDGASLVEYVLLLTLIAVVCVVSITYFGQSVDSRFSKVGSSVEAAPPVP